MLTRIPHLLLSTYRRIVDQKPVLAMPRSNLIQMRNHLVSPIGALYPFLCRIQCPLPLCTLPRTALHNPIATVQCRVLILDVGSARQDQSPLICYPTQRTLLWLKLSKEYIYIYCWKFKEELAKAIRIYRTLYLFIFFFFIFMMRFYADLCTHH